MIRNQQPLLRALIDAILLLECCGDDEIDPHTAVRGLENIAASLKALDADDRRELASGLERIAATETDDAYRTFIRRIPEMLDLG